MKDAGDALSLLTALGGLGMFLLGMALMTGGLRALAGARLRAGLGRATGRPARAALVGAGATALLQSSSAVIVTVVGFVGAGLMTFPQALGVILGANVGTTATGWIVSLLGIRLDLAALFAPLILLGALMSALSAGRAEAVGRALAGFGLLFIGIEAMQSGMGFLAERFGPGMFPGDDLAGRLKLVGIGLALTLVTQSSSAGIVAALAALASGLISFPQAAALAIGMDVGTTATALLSTIGGRSAARRTGAAHVVYNVLTGIMAFALLTPAGMAVSAWERMAGFYSPELALVAFHSGFNLLGAVLGLLFIRPLARLVEALTPERGPRLTAPLEERLLEEPPVAALAAAEAAGRIADDLLSALARALGGERPDLAANRDAVEALRLYVGRIRLGSADPAVHARMNHVIHMLDHLARLHHRAAQAERLALLAAGGAMAAEGRALAACLAAPGDEREAAASVLRARLEAEAGALRAREIMESARGEQSLDAAIAQLDAIRWAIRVADHVARLSAHRSALADPQRSSSP